MSEIRKRLPQYDYLYLGDNARAPYGTRSYDVVYQYTLQAVKELFDRGCHLVILACNTASAKALRTIQQHDLPAFAPDKRVLGVIRPSAEVLGELTRTGHVGVLATEGTVRSESYVIELHKFSPDTIVNQQACPMWVPLIENNRHFSDAGKLLIKEDVESLLTTDPLIDVILLGCTHYPLVQSYLEEIVPPHIKIIPQGAIIAISLEDYLHRHPELDVHCSKNGTISYLTTENTVDFNKKAANILGQDIFSLKVQLS